MYLLLTVLHTTEKIFGRINEFMTANEINWTKYVEVSTDGALAMSGKFTGFVVLIRKMFCCLRLFM